MLVVALEVDFVVGAVVLAFVVVVIEVDDVVFALQDAKINDVTIKPVNTIQITPFFISNSP